ncbi:MAG TPA: ATP synthase F1 subunit gamma [Rectinemataceae bacterium]|nr:ATP synthase F1 subunit gamma [Rectinemataceae bacterium]
MRDIRNRMRSVRQSLQVTGAMKLISTAKLRKARLRLDETRPYFEAIRDTMHDIIVHAEASGERWFDKRPDKRERKACTLVITADKGLAGGYNHAVIRFAEEACPPGSILLPIGQVGKRYFLEKDYVILEDFAVSRKEPTVYEAKDVASFAVDQFLSGRIDEFRVVFTRMHSTVKLEPEMIGLLPLDKEPILAKSRHELDSEMYSYEPSEDAVFDVLVPQYLKGIIYGALVEAFASEQAARMTAMDSASKNAEEMLGHLQLVYNRARQAAITSEVSEIVAGAAALQD